MNPFIKLANEQANSGSNNGQGGPFGAIITDKQGNIISTRE